MVLENPGQAPAKPLTWIGLAEQVQRMRPSERTRRRLKSLRRFCFVACAAEDEARVVAALDAARREGFVFWLDHLDQPPDAVSSVDTAAAIRGSMGVIVFCSHKSVKSNLVFRQIAAASQCSKQIIAIYLDDVTLPDGHRYYLSASYGIRNSEQKWQLKLTRVLEFLYRHAGRRPLPTRDVADVSPG